MLPVSPGDDLCLAAFHGHRIRIQDRIAENPARWIGGDEPRSAPGRSFAARSRAHRHAGQKTWHAVATGRASDPHGYGRAGWRNTGIGERRSDLGSFGAINE